MGDSRGAMGRKGGGEEEVWEPLEFGGNWRGLENFRYTRTGASSTWARLFESGERGGVLYMLCNVDGGVDVSFLFFSFGDIYFKCSKLWWEHRLFSREI